MKILLIGVGILIIIMTAVIFISPKNTNDNMNVQDKNTMTVSLTSPAFENNNAIPAKYTCDGENINPALVISGISKNAESLALIVDDPDAPSGTWVHWLVWNINPKTSKVEENSVPNGAVEGVTSFGKTGYDGPCPPAGTHRYFFKLYALDMKLNLSPSDKKDKLEAAMKNHILGYAEIVGLYSREN